MTQIGENSAFNVARINGEALKNALNGHSGTVIREIRVMNVEDDNQEDTEAHICLLYTSPSPRDQRGSRMPSSA